MKVSGTDSTAAPDARSSRDTDDPIAVGRAARRLPRGWVRLALVLALFLFWPGAANLRAATSPGGCAVAPVAGASIWNLGHPLPSLAVAQPDILKEFLDRLDAWIGGLPPAVLTLPARTGLILGLATLVCLVAFQAGSRSARLQGGTACLVGLVAAFLPVDALVSLLQQAGGIAATLAFVGFLTSNVVLPRMLATYLHPKLERQQLIAKGLLGTLALLFLVNLIVAFRARGH